MSIDLESQIRAIADEAFAQTSAVHADRHGDVVASSSGQKPSNEQTMELMEEDKMDTSNRKWLPLLVAAAIVALIVGVVAVAAGDESGQPVIQPSPDGTTPPTPEPGAEQSEAATAVGEQFVEAFAAGDPDAAVALVSDTSENVDVSGAGDPSEFDRLFDWFDITGWQFEPRGCEFREPDQVSCTVAHSNDWYDPAGLAPLEGTFFLKVEDEQIAAVRLGVGADHIQAYFSFEVHVKTINPDDFAIMFDPRNNGYPQLTDEALELFEQYSATYPGGSDDGDTGASDLETAALPSDLMGTWVATNRAPGTTWEITEDVIAANLVVGGSANQTRESVEMAYTATATTLEISDDTGGDGCPAGESGVYEWQIENNVLTVTLVSDGCSGRGEHNDGMTLERTE